MRYGLTTEELYPYKGGSITSGINFEKLKFRKKYQIRGYGVVKPGEYDTTALMWRVARQPTVAAVDASHWPKNGWKGIRSGPFKVPEQTNHEVLITGYKSQDITKVPYWEFRNSWGTDFGDAGYAKLELGINAFGVESDNWYPLLSSAHNKDSPLKVATDECQRIMKELFIYQKGSEDRSFGNELADYYRDQAIPECCYRLRQFAKKLKEILTLEAIEKREDTWRGREFLVAERVIREIESLLGA